MHINTTTCYALQIVLYLVRNRRTVSSTELAKTLEISQRYTLLTAAKLRDGGFISAQAGKNGGYFLKREPPAISVYDVITLVEGSMGVPDCLKHPPDCGIPCKNLNLLNSLSAMSDYLEAYLKTIRFDELSDMDINGRLSDILELVENHIRDMKQKEKG